MDTNTFTSQPATNNISQPSSPVNQVSRATFWLKIQALIGVLLGLPVLIWFILRLNSPTKISSWNDIIPGQTTKIEVINKLGNPLEEKAESFGQIMTYDSGIKALPNTIIYDTTTGKVSGTLITVSDKAQAENFYQEMLKLGKPEKIMYSKYLQFSKIYIFAQKGISYSANETTKTVDAIHYFQPTTLDKYLSQFGGFFSEDNPYSL